MSYPIHFLPRQLSVISVYHNSVLLARVVSNIAISIIEL